MMKYFCILVFSSVILVNSIYAKKVKTAPPIINFDITNTIQDLIGDILDNFCKTAKQWNENKLILEEYSTDDENAPTQPKNYSISYGKISMIQSGSHTIETTPKVLCQFSESLEVRIPIPGFQFFGSFNISGGDSTQTVQYNYSVDIKDIELIFVTEANFNIDDPLPNNQSNVDIYFGQVDSVLKTSDHDDIHAFEELSALSKKIKFSLKSLLTEKLSRHIKTPIYSYISTYSFCLNPRSEIIRHHRAFEIQDQQHYYQIGEVPSTSCDFLNLQITPIRIRGLWNLDSLNMTIGDSIYKTKRYNGDVLVLPYGFNLRIVNLEGETSWYVQEVMGNSSTANELKFTIDTLSINGRMYSEDHLIDGVDVNFELSIDEGDNDSDQWSILFKKVVLQRLRPVLQSAFEKSIFQKYLSTHGDYFYPYYYN